MRFTTYFTRDFLPLAAVSIKRFIQFNPSAFGTVFCFEKSTKTELEDLFCSQHISFINVMEEDDLVKDYNVLSKDRNKLEVITSMKATFIQVALMECYESEMLVYFDPDVIFFGSLEERLPELTTDITVFSQLGLDKVSSNLYGRFNAGIILARKSQKTELFLSRWQQLCYAKCILRAVDGHYADQKYLDELSLFDGFAGKLDPTQNLSTRAFKRELPHLRFESDNKVLYVNGRRLISFHFHGFRVLPNGILTGINRFGTLHNKLQLFKRIYLPILIEIGRLQAPIGKCLPADSEFRIFDKTLLFYLDRKRFLFPFLLSIYRMLRLTIVPSWVIRALGRL